MNFWGHVEKFGGQNPQNSKRQGGHGKPCPLTLSQTGPGFYVSTLEAVGNSVGKAEIACNEQNFLPFICRLQTLSLEEAKICCLGKG